MVLRRCWESGEGAVLPVLREGEEEGEKKETRGQMEEGFVTLNFHGYWLYFYHHPVLVSHPKT